MDNNMMAPQKKSHGALIGSIIIIIIIIIGGIYIWQSKVKTLNEEPANVQSQEMGELNTLEADLNETDTSTGVNVDDLQ